ncbi:TRAP-type mannitol/chloroaromatic compound transport system, periplasmic component [Rubidibacter lacunae KORDI 51-2]|uniref:TRAP-type mannitol/chloroaromatic compound transport system, periplasmic component n=1 Tax=Rubidibacter lacunae KORDI 51-2 TaxID=582515 RepID=U5DCW3_9CHRO|nr:TRAP transporter substrate-binding protein DctP [Rubidibacter lacunae]ERN42368.1 TRAP-type mannitol/chloroaromatic compound transport system, periplasmic component [Rubidibacter lacunae KORDI 51-2]
MKRRQFITSAAVGAAGSAAIAACSQSKTDSNGESSAPAVQVDDRKSVRWRMASSYTPALDTIYGGSEFFIERVKELTDGKFEISLSASGEIVPGLEVLDAVQQGTVQSGHTNSYYYRGKNEALAFDTAVPFGLNYRQQTAWMYEGGGLDLVHELLSDFNIISFPGGNSGTQMGGWWNKKIDTPADLEGINMRIPGLGGVVMERLGVNVQNIAGGEIFQALQLGTIDAAEYVGPYDDEKLGLYKAANIYYYPGWWEPGTQYSFYFNLDAWNDLPPSYQSALRTAAAEAHANIMARYDTLNPGALKSLLDQGVELVRFSDEIMASAQDIAFELNEELAAGDASYKKIYDAWQQFQSNSNRWFSTAELGYTDFSFRSS